MRLAAVLLVTVVASSTSCMFFRSLDDLTAARDADAANDGGNDGTTLDGATEETSPGADGAANESGADGGSDAPAPPLDAASPCDAGQSFALCADFDRDASLTDGWDSRDKGRVGSADRSTAQAASAPASFFSENPALPSGDADLTNALLIEKAGVYARAVLTFDIYVDSFSAKAGDFGVGVAVMLLRTNDVTTGTVLSLGMSGPFLSVEGTTTDYFDAPALPLDRWAHVVLDFKTSGTFDYSIDGKSGSRSFAPVTLSGTLPRAAVSLGLHSFDTPSAACAAYYDNVTWSLE